MKRGGQPGLKPPNSFENNGATPHALIRCIVLDCCKNNCPLRWFQCFTSFLEFLNKKTTPSIPKIHVIFNIFLEHVGSFLKFRPIFATKKFLACFLYF